MLFEQKKATKARNLVTENVSFCSRICNRYSFKNTIEIIQHNFLKKMNVAHSELIAWNE